MTISWYGEACFLLESSGVRILIEPPQKESGINPPRLKSDVLICSHTVSQDKEAATFIIDSPGEYEIKGANIRGISDGTNINNIIYNIEMDDIKIAHLGFISGNLSSDKLEILDDPDIVLVAVGGIKNEILDAEGAMKLINNLEPSVAIPMLYDIKGLKIKRAPLTNFIKESEAKEPPQPKLAIKKKDLNKEETKIVILEKI